MRAAASRAARPYRASKRSLATERTDLPLRPPEAAPEEERADASNCDGGANHHDEPEWDRLISNHHGRWVRRGIRGSVTTVIVSRPLDDPGGGLERSRSKFAGFTQQFFDVPSEFSHGRIMTGPRGTIPEHSPRRPSRRPIHPCALPEVAAALIRAQLGESQ